MCFLPSKAVEHLSYRCRLYPVDRNRVNEYGESYEEQKPHTQWALAWAALEPLCSTSWMVSWLSIFECFRWIPGRYTFYIAKTSEHFSNVSWVQSRGVWEELASLTVSPAWRHLSRSLRCWTLVVILGRWWLSVQERPVSAVAMPSPSPVSPNLADSRGREVQVSTSSCL